MTTEGSTPLPSLPGRARPVHWRNLLVRSLLVGALLALAAGLPGASRMRDKYGYREGDIARERIVAPFDFRVIKDETSLRREQQAAASAVPRCSRSMRASRRRP